MTAEMFARLTGAKPKASPPRPLQGYEPTGELADKVPAFQEEVRQKMEEWEKATYAENRYLMVIPADRAAEQRFKYVNELEAQWTRERRPFSAPPKAAAARDAATSPGRTVGGGAQQPPATATAASGRKRKAAAL